MMGLRNSFVLPVVAAFATTLAACGGSGAPGAPQSPLGSEVGLSNTSARTIPASKSDPLLYFSTGSEVDIYEQAGTHQSPIGTLTTGLDGPSGMVVDATGDLYVTNPPLGNIVVFHKGETTPYKTLTGVSQNTQYRNDVTTGPDGTVYAVGQKAKYVYVFANGSTTPTSTLKTHGVAAELAMDTAGDLFVQPFSGSVQEFVAGSTVPKTLSPGTNSPGGIAIDAQGNMYLCYLGGEDGYSGEIYVCAPPYTGPAILTTGLFNGVYACAVNDISGNLWAATSGNVAFAERFNHALKENDLIQNYGGAGIAVESGKL